MMEIDKAREEGGPAFDWLLPTEYLDGIEDKMADCGGDLHAEDAEELLQFARKLLRCRRYAADWTHVSTGKLPDYDVAVLVIYVSRGSEPSMMIAKRTASNKRGHLWTIPRNCHVCAWTALPVIPKLPQSESIENHISVDLVYRGAEDSRA